jgi:hypothetical protein
MVTDCLAGGEAFSFNLFSTDCKFMRHRRHGIKHEIKDPNEIRKN